MPLYTTLASLSQTPSSNAADGTTDPPSSIDNQTNLLASFIAKIRDGVGFSGGAGFLGAVSVTASGGSIITLNAPTTAATDYNSITGYAAGQPRWQVLVGDNTTLKDFKISRFNSSGVFQDTPFSIDNAGGTVTINGTTMAAKANLASPTFTGTPAAPTAATGTRSTQIATMQKFADEFGVLLSGNGYQKLPSGLIVQWGSSTGLTNGASALPVTYPIAFPNAVFTFIASNGDTGASIASAGCGGFTTTTANVVYFNSGAGIGSGIGVRANWVAIGY